MIEWRARKSTQQKEAQKQEAVAGSKQQQQASAAEQQEQAEKGKDIRLLEMGGEEASETEAKTGKHEYTHLLK